MRFILSLGGLLLFSGFNVSAQDKWNLKTIVEYAMQNNLSVRQATVQAKVSAVNYKQSKLSVYPNLTFNGNTSLNNGNNQDPVTFQRINETYLTAGMQLQTSVDIFNFYSKKNRVLADEWELKAAVANVGKVQNDVALSAANAYLQILLALEQQKIAKVQVDQTKAQLAVTRKQVDAGALPELNAVQLESQLALDSVNYINAKGLVTQSILTLKAFMNIDAAADFEVDTPPVESIPVELIADLQPDYVFRLALENQPLQQYNAYKIKAAEKSRDAARGALYPSFSLFGGASSNLLSFKKKGIYDRVINGYTSSGLRADAGGGVFYEVQSPVFTKGNLLGYQRSDPFFRQLNNNLRQSIGLSVSVPIFNGGSLRANLDRSKLNIESLDLQKQQADQQLKQDIYSAYTASLIALEKFNASAKSVAASQQTFDFANKRFGVGMLSTYDLITSQNNLLRAKLDYTINQFDYVFKMKVLEFYKGQGLKL